MEWPGLQRRGRGNAHSGGHITPRQAGFALAAGAGRASEALHTGMDGYARSAVANFRA